MFPFPAWAGRPPVLSVHRPTFCVSDQIGNRHLSSCKLTDLPLVLARGQFFHHFTQFLWPICPQARYYSVEQQNQGDDRNQVRPEQPRPAERTNPRSVQKQQENAGKYEADGQGSAPGGLKYADAFAGINGILQNGASILRRKMMERGKHRSQPLQCPGNLPRVNRLWIESDVVVRGRADTSECLEIRIFIRDPNLKACGISSGVTASQLSSKIQPRTTSARTDINNRLSGRRLSGVRPVPSRVNHALEQRSDGRVGP